MWVLMVDFLRDLMKVTFGNFYSHDDKCATQRNSVILDYNKNLIFFFFSLTYFYIIPFQS